MNPENLQKDRQFNETIKQQILTIARKSYDNVRNCWTGEECFCCSLMHELFQNLIHLHCKQITKILKDKIHQHFSGENERPYKNCINKFCFNFDLLQSKNRQDQAALIFLQNLLTVMIETSCDAKNTSEKEDCLLDLQYELNCNCQKCRTVSSDSSKTIKDSSIQAETFFNSLKQIQACFIKQKIGCQPKYKIQRIFNSIRQERRQINEIKQNKRLKIQQNWQNYGELLGLDREKYLTDFNFKLLDEKQSFLLKELFKKNFNNENIIKHFEKKIDRQRSRQKLAEANTYPLTKRNSIESACLQKQSYQSSPHKASLLLTNHSFRYGRPQRKQANQFQIIRNFQQPITTLKRLKVKIEQSLKQCEPKEIKRVSILKSVLFNPGDMFQTAGKSIQRKPYLRRFDRVVNSDKSTMKGLRKSIQQCVRSVCNSSRLYR